MIIGRVSRQRAIAAPPAPSRGDHGAESKVQRRLKHRAFGALIGAAISAPGSGRADVVTQRNDNGRTGATTDTITPVSFADGKWQKLASLAVDGTVYAQPLYLQGLLVGGATRNVVYIATARNKVYAYDAAPPYPLIWSTTLGPPDLSDNSLFTASAASSPTHVNDVTGINEYGIGIQSTPVIDRAAGYLYLTFRTGDTVASHAQQYIARVALTTGATTTSPITATNLGQPVSAVRQRPSLLLMNGVIYAGFGAHAEELSLDGWNPTTWFPSQTASAQVSGVASLPAGAPLATQHRGPELDVFAVDVNGDLEMLSVVSSWSAQRIQTAATGKFPPLAGLAADAQRDTATTIDVFAVDQSGTLSVYRSANSAGASWTGSQIPGASLAPGAKLATGHQVGGSIDILDVFGIGGRIGQAIDPDSIVAGAFNATLTNNGALTVASATGSGPWSVKSIKRNGHAPGVPGGNLAVLNEGPGQLDVFYVGENGATQVYFVGGTTTAWANAELKLYATPGAPIAAVAQSLSWGYPLQIDVLVPQTNHVFLSTLVPPSWSSPLTAL